MFPFYTSKEAGKTISADNAKKIQNIHDTVSSLGAACGVGGSGGMYESARVTEAALPMNTSHDALRGHIRTALMSAHGVQNTYDNNGPWINDVFPEHVVYSHKGETLKRKYTATQGKAGSDPTITLGDSKKVHTAYVDSAAADKECMRVLLAVPDGAVEDRAAYTTLVSEGGVAKPESVIITPEMVRESVTICEPVVPVIDKGERGGFAVKEAGRLTIPVCIIKPGWGTCAYYGKEMIQKTGPAAFPKGTQMFINHATESQELERPEGDMNDLAAVLNRTPYWDDNGPKGAGLYSEALLFSDHADKILEKGPYTGCSVNALVKSSFGEAEGRTGKIAEAFMKGLSVDFVTKAGAGGAPIVPVTESARAAPVQESATMTETEITALRKERDDAVSRTAILEGQVRTMESQQNLILAVATVGSLVREAGFQVKQSLLERVCSSPKLKDGKIDPEWAKEAAADLIGVGETAGRVTGVGEGRTRESAATTQTEDDKAFKESLRSLGVPEAGLEYAMEVYR